MTQIQDDHEALEDEGIKMRALEMNGLLTADHDQSVLEQAWSTYRSMVQEVNRFSLNRGQAIRDPKA